MIPIKLVEMMFGKAITLGARMPGNCGEVALSLRKMAVEDYRMHIGDIDLDVCSGEVIGVAGMEGSGQGLFLRALAGIVRTVGGQVIVGGQDLTGHDYHVLNSMVCLFYRQLVWKKGWYPD